MPELLIIDGSSMLSTCYYGNLPKSILFAKTEEEKEKHYEQILHTSDGKYTNAMFTMLRTLLGIYKKVKPEYVAFVFDKTRDTFRRTELGADFYKANRKETAKPLKEQFIQMEEFLQEIGCAVFMSDDYEADDYAASLVEKFEGPDLQHLKTASRNQQFYFSHIVHSCFTLTVTPSPKGMIEVIRDGLCFSSYRYSRILLYMVLFLRSTR